MKSRLSIRFLIVTALSLGLALLLGVNPGLLGNAVLAQNPQPTTKANTLPKLSLVPLVLVNVGLDNLAFPVFSPTGAPRSAPEFFLPRTGTKEFSVTTSGGNVTVHFSDSVPAGVPASGFQWVQSEVPAGNAVGRLRYSGCPGCPDSFNIDIGAASRESVHTVVKIHLTASSGRPVMTKVELRDINGANERWWINFEHSTFDPTDSQVIATYPSGLKYRLIPDAESSFANGRMEVTIPRLEVGRTVKVSLVNEYGSSGSSTITLAGLGSENPDFADPVVPSPALAFPNGRFSIKHGNFGPLTASGTDEIPIQPFAAASACNQVDFIYLGVKISWLDDNHHPTSQPGTVTIASQPPTNAPVRSANNKVRVNYTLKGLNGDKVYEVVLRGVEVVGICRDRVIH